MHKPQLTRLPTGRLAATGMQPLQHLNPGFTSIVAAASLVQVSLSHAPYWVGMARQPSRAVARLSETGQAPH